MPSRSWLHTALFAIANTCHATPPLSATPIVSSLGVIGTMLKRSSVFIQLKRQANIELIEFSQFFAYCYFLIFFQGN